MGNHRQNHLYYMTAAILIGLGLLFVSGLNGKKSRGLHLFDESISDSGVTSNVPSMAHRRSRSTESGTTQTFDSGYQPSTFTGRPYVHQADEPGMPGSSKSSKKNAKAKAKAKKKALAEAKKKKNKGNRELAPFEDSSDDSFVGGPTNMAAAPAPRAAQAKKKEEEENINSFEYWQEPIFVEEDAMMVGKLIDSYQIKKVSSNVFYSLVTEMRQDERPNIREFGLQALTATPSRQSFSELTMMKHTDTEASLRTGAGREVSRYADAGRLTHVLGALRADSEGAPKVTIEAMRTITTSTKKYSDLRQLSEETPSGSKASTELLTERFETAKEIIEASHAKSSNPQIKSEATKTVAAINKFIVI